MKEERRPFQNAGGIRLELSLRWAEENRNISTFMVGLGIGLGALTELAYKIGERSGVTISPKIRRASRLVSLGMVGVGVLGASYFEGMAESAAKEIGTRLERGDPYMVSMLKDRLDKKINVGDTVPWEQVRRKLLS